MTSAPQAPRRIDDQFVVFAPDGLEYWPPKSIGGARATIARRSAYAGEPGWQIVPLRLALDYINRPEVH